MPESPIPRHEQTVLSMSVFEAHDLARDGEIASGYDCLRGGLALAREAEERGEDWAPALIAAWEREIERYCREWGVKL